MQEGVDYRGGRKSDAADGEVVVFADIEVVVGAQRKGGGMRELGLCGGAVLQSSRTDACEGGDL